MKHILDEADNNINFDRYATYVETIKAKLPLHVYDFASNPELYNLSSKSSLHDAWLEHITISEPSSGERNEIRKLEIEMVLLGPHHDRTIKLKYMGVSKYNLGSPARPGEPRFTHTAHGDLHTHEIRLSSSGLIEHELLFERGTSFLIECEDLKHSEILIESGT